MDALLSPFLLLSILPGWGVAFFVLYAWRTAQRRDAHRITTLQENLHMAENARAGDQVKLAELEATRAALATSQQDLRVQESAYAALKARMEERESALANERVQMEREFQAITGRLLGDAHATFLRQANETFEKHQEKVTAMANARQKEMDVLMTPMKETLTRYETGLRDMRDQQKKAQGELEGRIKELAHSTHTVSTQTAKLATALKSGPATRGRWGEIQLRNVVELAGLSVHCDFTEQHSVRDEGKLKRPDLTVKLPGGRLLAIDSKVALSAYMQAVDAQQEEHRQQLLQKHADEIRQHVKALSAKEYTSALKNEGVLDFIIMFVPGESLLGAAIEARPQLFDEAFEKGVLLATPVTLVAILKSVAYGWRQEKATQNARRVADLAADLYDSLRRMGTNLAGVGKSLEGTVNKYNAAIASIESRVMPKARKFSDYEMPGTDQKIEQLQKIEQSARTPRANKDLIIEQSL